MKDATQQLMRNAEETLNAAEKLLEAGYLRDAINRAYYAIFYIAEALLNEKDLHYSKHGTAMGRLRSTISKQSYSTKSIISC